MYATTLRLISINDNECAINAAFQINEIAETAEHKRRAFIIQILLTKKLVEPELYAEADDTNRKRLEEIKYRQNNPHYKEEEKKGPNKLKRKFSETKCTFHAIDSFLKTSCPNEYYGGDDSVHRMYPSSKGGHVDSEHTNNEDIIEERQRYIKLLQLKSYTYLRHLLINDRKKVTIFDKETIQIEINALTKLIIDLKQEFTLKE
jgi:hypothetical protein